MSPFAHTRRLALAAALGLAVILEASALSAAEPQAPSLGKPDAKVTVTEFASLTCPHCAAFAKETMPEVKQRYIDTGKIKYVFRDFPLDELAVRAAQLAHCAGPDRFFQFLDVFFAQQASWVEGPDPIAALKQLARLGGVSDAQADACLADKSLEDSILKSRLDAQQQYNISSTPSFVIGGKVYAGEQSIDDFAKLIDPLLQ